MPIKLSRETTTTTTKDYVEDDENDDVEQADGDDDDGLEATKEPAARPALERVGHLRATTRARVAGARNPRDGGGF